MELSPMIFVLTILIALAITLLTVSIQTFKTAMNNPLKALRSE
jgi:ABC-type antimicrobial peptide transport system permease subunit